MDVVVAGHICLDIIPAWEQGGIDSITPGQLIEMSGIELSTGGAVSNTGISLNRLGIDTRLVGKVGQDGFGRIIIDILRETSDTIAENMIVSPGETTSYTVVINPPDTDRIFLHYPGTNDTFLANDIPYSELSQAQVFHFGYPPLMEQFYRDEGQQLASVFRRARQLDLVTSLDMALPDPDSPAGKAPWKNILDRALPDVDIFLPSIEELLYMLDRKNHQRLQAEGPCALDGTLLNRISSQLLEMGTRVAVIKLGDQGLYLRTGRQPAQDSPLSRLVSEQEWSERELLIPCFSADLAGTTGAGDAAIAGFLAELLNGSGPDRCLTVAAAVGASSVEDVTATGGIRPLVEVKERIANGWEQRPNDIQLTDWTRTADGLWRGPGDKS